MITVTETLFDSSITLDILPSPRRDSLTNFQTPITRRKKREQEKNEICDGPGVPRVSRSTIATRICEASVYRPLTCFDELFVLWNQFAATSLTRLPLMARAGL